MTGHLLQRELALELPTAVRGEGVYVIDRRGRRYLDAAAGGGVSCLGHSDSDVIVAIKDQLDRLGYANNAVFANEPAEAAAELLAHAAPSGLDQVYFVTGGSEAVEAALKVARQYFVEVGEPQRTTVVSRQNSFHGNTLGSLSVTGNPARRKLYEPFVFDIKQVSACYAYRDQADDESAGQYGDRVADELEFVVDKLGPKSILAFIAEPVVGATLGAVPAVPGYFARIRDICNRYGILLILDEVMCGMGRTGTLFAFEQEGIAPDIVCVSKALGGGYQPVAATIVSRQIRDVIAGGSGIVQHFHTYQAHPVACAAAYAVLRKITRPDLLAQVQTKGDRLKQVLKAGLTGNPNVGDVRGRGLMIGIEFVPGHSRARSEQRQQLNTQVRQQAMKLGLTTTGPIGDACDCVMLAPPYIASDREIDEIAELFIRAVNLADVSQAAAE